MTRCDLYEKEEGCRRRNPNAEEGAAGGGPETPGERKKNLKSCLGEDLSFWRRLACKNGRWDTHVSPTRMHDSVWV